VNFRFHHLVPPTAACCRRDLLSAEFQPGSSKRRRQAARWHPDTLLYYCVLHGGFPNPSDSRRQPRARADALPIISFRSLMRFFNGDCPQISVGEYDAMTDRCQSSQPARRDSRSRLGFQRFLENRQVVAELGTDCDEISVFNPEFVGNLAHLVVFDCRDAIVGA